MRLFRFAPSPNGRLHLGHARSALLNAWVAERAGGTWLLRIEDIDTTRARPAFVDGILEDLHWLGLSWPAPVMVQSDRLAIYTDALDDLNRRGLVYPCFATRTEIKAAVSADTPRDPEGQPLYPGLWRGASQARIDAASGAPAWRLDMARAIETVGTPVMTWSEGLIGERCVMDVLAWGDVILARRDIGTSYHLAVVIDDAAQGITDVVRGMDLFAATAIHRLLQRLLNLPEPRYAHHALILDTHGDKLAKSKGSASLHDLRAEGHSAVDVIRMAGMDDPEAHFSVRAGESGSARTRP